MSLLAINIKHALRIFFIFFKKFIATWYWDTDAREGCYGRMIPL